MTYRHEPYTITLTLTVSDEDRDGTWLVTADGCDDFGHGITPYRAVQDFLESMAVTMRVLMEESHPLGKGLNNELSRLTVWAEGRL